jgi:radical SAM family RiPP maturation amino acid epimerase
MNDQNLARLDRVLNAAFEQHPEFLRPLLNPRAAQQVPWMADVARTKRFLEWWSADRAFREAVCQDASAANSIDIGVDAEELRYIWDPVFHSQVARKKDWVAPKSVQQYRAFIGEKLRYREQLRRNECIPTDPRHKAWRQRQVNRLFGHLGPSAHENIIHAPFAIELTEGCSVGCWFCGVYAEKKKTDFLYTDENRELWQSVLTVFRDRLGPAAGQGFMYWATDPLDNPDYEKFGLDFARICGRFPQTTTAQPQKHFERVRALLKLSAEHGCEINRFSVLSIGTFRKIMQFFTPEELLHTELVLQNREGNTMQSNSGRARGSNEIAKRAENHGLETGWEEAPGTISCVSGYLINMITRTVRLVTPCPSSEKWPSGHWVLEQGQFTDAASFAALIDGMMERNMPITLKAGDRVRFRADLKLGVSADEIVLTAYGAITTMSDYQPHMAAMAQALAAGNMTAGELAISLEDRFGWPAEQAMSALYWLFDQGLLDEEPCQATVVAPPTALRREKEKETAS